MAWLAPEDRRRLAEEAASLLYCFGKEELAAVCDFRWQNFTNELK